MIDFNAHKGSFLLLKTIENLFQSVLCSINSYDNFEKTYVHRITSSTQWRCNGTQISPKMQLFGPEKNFAARATLATTSNLQYKSFTYKEKERKQETNTFHFVCLNRGQFHQQKLFLHQLIKLLKGKIEMTHTYI